MQASLVQYTVMVDMLMQLNFPMFTLYTCLAHSNAVNFHSIFSLEVYHRFCDGEVYETKHDITP